MRLVGRPDGAYCQVRFPLVDPLLKLVVEGIQGHRILLQQHFALGAFENCGAEIERGIGTGDGAESESIAGPDDRVSDDNRTGEYSRGGGETNQARRKRPAKKRPGTIDQGTGEQRDAKHRQRQQPREFRRQRDADQQRHACQARHRPPLAEQPDGGHQEKKQQADRHVILDQRRHAPESLDRG